MWTYTHNHKLSLSRLPLNVRSCAASPRPAIGCTPLGALSAGKRAPSPIKGGDTLPRTLMANGPVETSHLGLRDPLRPSQHLSVSSATPHASLHGPSAPAVLASCVAAALVDACRVTTLGPCVAFCGLRFWYGCRCGCGGCGCAAPRCFSFASLLLPARGRTFGAETPPALRTRCEHAHVMFG